MIIHRTVKIYFAIIVILILSVGLFGFIDSDSIGNFLFPQGDNNFHVANLENGENEKILSLQEAFITGSTYFTDGQNQYLGYILATEINYGEFSSILIVVDFSDSSKLYEVNLPFFERKINGTVIFHGLTVHHLNDKPIFSTIMSAGTTQSNEKTSIMQFSLNGSILKMIEYNIIKYPYAKLHDICIVDHTTYIVLTTLLENEILNSEANNMMLLDFEGNTSDIILLEQSARSLTYDPKTDLIFTSARGSQFVSQLNSNGDLVRTINVKTESSEIDLIDSSNLILREYKENRSNLYYAIGGSITFLILIPLILQKSKIKRD
jgi:hypothetical protein